MELVEDDVDVEVVLDVLVVVLVVDEVLLVVVVVVLVLEEVVDQVRVTSFSNANSAIL